MEMLLNQNNLPQTHGSHQLVNVICDYCGKEYSLMWKVRVIQNKTLDKDACKLCRYKKRDEISPNPFTREDVKAKIKKINLERYGAASYTSTDEFKSKAIQTNIAKYGVINAMQNRDIMDKHNKKILDKYGVENVSMLDDIKAKRKKTCSAKFGHEYFVSSEEGKKRLKKGIQSKYGNIDNVFQVEAIKNKIKTTNIQKFGVEYPTQNKDIIKLIKNNNLNKYGVDNPAKLDSIKQKIRKTNLEKYGVDNPAKLEICKNKSIATNLKKYGYKYPTQNINIKEKIYNTKVASGQILLYNNKNKRQLAAELGHAYSTFNVLVNRHGFEYAIAKDPHKNSLEEKIRQLLDGLKIKYIPQFKVENRIADFYIPFSDLIIELDGIYWHSELIIKDNYYHIKKKNLYDKCGYNSLFFRENEINNCWDIVQSIIKNKLGLSNKLYARKCCINIVNKEIGKQFVIDNHLMGKGAGDIFGLYCDNQLYMIMQVKRIRNNNYEISRICTKCGFNVVGGFSKLLSYINKNIKMDTLCSFVDRRYGDGKYLNKLGFNMINCSPSFRWTNGFDVFNRMRFPGQEGYSRDLFKIWDCGQAKFIKVYNTL